MSNLKSIRAKSSAYADDKQKSLDIDWDALYDFRRADLLEEEVKRLESRLALAESIINDMTNALSACEFFNETKG